MAVHSPTSDMSGLDQDAVHTSSIASTAAPTSSYASGDDTVALTVGRSEVRLSFIHSVPIWEPDVPAGTSTVYLVRDPLSACPCDGCECFMLSMGGSPSLPSSS